MAGGKFCDSDFPPLIVARSMTCAHTVVGVEYIFILLGREDKEAELLATVLSP
jgi:hypothetical protein